jgi:ABC-2 type transport system permease protein
MSAFDISRHESGGPQPTPARTLSARHTFFWSLRREWWENRSIYLAPLIVAGVVLFSTLMGNLGLPKKIRTLSSLEPARQHAVVVRPYSMAPAPIMLCAFIVGVFYCMEALYGERRERSILFWKSLPVSDRTTVLAKAAIPLAVLPLLAFTLSVLTLFVLFVHGTVWLAVNGVSPAPLWRELRFVQEPLIMLYGLTVHTLWFAPIYAYLLLISAWAKRAPFLWAILPPMAISAMEMAAFNTRHFMGFLTYRVGGAMKEAFAFKVTKGHEILDRVSQLSPANFLTRPGLWLGLMFAAACLAAAVRVRRNREPI